MTTDDWAPVVIPDDGQEHSCPCGASGYRTWDCDGWRPPIVVDDEG